MIPFVTPIEIPFIVSLITAPALSISIPVTDEILFMILSILDTTKAFFSFNSILYLSIVSPRALLTLDKNPEIFPEKLSWYALISIRTAARGILDSI